MDAEPTGTASIPTVLVVDDNQPLANLYSTWVEAKWDCETVYSGPDAIATMGDAVDVILLDRNMPELSGNDVLERNRENYTDVQGMMVSGVDPDIDIVELPIDDYLQKPVDRPTIQSKIGELLLRRTYHQDVEQFFVCAAKVNALETAMSPSELAESEEYLTLKKRADELRREAEVTIDRMSDQVAAFEHVDENNAGWN